LTLPYYIGCPSWNEPAWRGFLYPENASPSDYLRHYGQVLNAVEGNTTFYAQPSADTVARWAERMPVHLRFCAKLPRTISHSGDLREKLDAAADFRRLLAPLGERVAPFWLQLSASFGPPRLPELACFLDDWQGGELAVEVRHPGFFDKGEAERSLNRLLHGRGIERICLDSRALFSCTSREPAVLHAQSKKPRLPLRPAAFSQSPQLRFIGHPELAENDPFITPWLSKVAAWIEEGRTPYVFLHTSDNRRAPELALRFHRQLMGYLPGLADLPAVPGDDGASEQLGLL
jgi:uncharacterized protein YecE (DUF72 family)